MATINTTCLICTKPIFFVTVRGGRTPKYCLECYNKVRKYYLKQYGKKYSKQYYLNNQEKIKLSSKEYHSKNINTIKGTRKEYRLNNKEKISKINKNYRLNNKEKIKLFSKEYRSKNIDNAKEYRLNNKEKISEFNKQYRLNNKGKIKLLSKEYRLKNRDKLKITGKKYYDENKEKINLSRVDYRKKYHLINKDKINKKVKEYYLNNKEKVKKYQKEYRNKNWEKIKEKSRSINLVYVKKRYKNDPAYRILVNSRQRLGKFLKKKKINKNNTTLELIGCTPKDLKKHIEKQFLPGMSWDNYRYDIWHIDHIRPLALAKTMVDIVNLKLMHYTNLQPLWAKDNIKKSDYVGKVRSKDIKV
jgi:hypothetical protein